MKQHIKNVVLVHGAFADGSGWKRVADILKNDGYKVSVAQPPETSYADDQKYTKAAIDAMGGPVVLVGHSYGGSIITEAGNHANVAALVYIAAFALDEGESCASSVTTASSPRSGITAPILRNIWERSMGFMRPFSCIWPTRMSSFPRLHKRRLKRHLLRNQMRRSIATRAESCLLPP